MFNYYNILVVTKMNFISRNYFVSFNHFFSIYFSFDFDLHIRVRLFFFTSSSIKGGRFFGRRMATEAVLFRPPVLFLPFTLLTMIRRWKPQPNPSTALFVSVNCFIYSLRLFALNHKL